jgi:hypothetical protein
MKNVEVNSLSLLFITLTLNRINALNFMSLLQFIHPFLVMVITAASTAVGNAFRIYKMGRICEI